MPHTHHAMPTRHRACHVIPYDRRPHILSRRVAIDASPSIHPLDTRSALSLTAHISMQVIWHTTRRFRSLRLPLLLACITACSTALAEAAPAPVPPTIQAASWLVVDGESGQIRARCGRGASARVAHQAHDRVYRPACIARRNPGPDEKVTVGVSDVAEVGSDEAHMYLVPGQRVTVRNPAGPDRRVGERRGAGAGETSRRLACRLRAVDERYGTTNRHAAHAFHHAIRHHDAGQPFDRSRSVHAGTPSHGGLPGILRLLVEATLRVRKIRKRNKNWLLGRIRLWTA